MFIVRLSQDRSKLNVKLHEDFQIVVVLVYDPYLREKAGGGGHATYSLTMTKLYILLLT